MNDILTIVLSIATFMVSHTLWYSKLFEQQWLSLSGFTKKDVEPSSKAVLGSLLNGLVVTLVLRIFVTQSGAASFGEGAYIGFIAAFGFVATTRFSEVIWAKKSLQLFAIDVGAAFMNLMVMGGVIAALS